MLCFRSENLLDADLAEPVETLHDGVGIPQNAHTNWASKLWKQCRHIDRDRCTLHKFDSDKKSEHYSLIQYIKKDS